MLMCEIIRSRIESDRISDFVAIGNLINDHTSTHSAFVIQHNNILFEFHYTGQEVEFKDLDKDYYHKITDTIVSDEVPALIAYCKSIINRAKPTYGFFYSGEFYDRDGIHHSDSILGETMTCVGFCLNIFKGFLENEYINYSDWTEESHNSKDYLEKFCQQHGLDPDIIAPNHRRISPREILTSCFFTELPIRKQTIDEKIVWVDEHFNARFQSTHN